MTELAPPNDLIVEFLFCDTPSTYKTTYGTASRLQGARHCILQQYKRVNELQKIEAKFEAEVDLLSLDIRDTPIKKTNNQSVLQVFIDRPSGPFLCVLRFAQTGDLTYMQEFSQPQQNINEKVLAELRFQQLSKTSHFMNKRLTSILTVADDAVKELVNSVTSILNNDLTYNLINNMKLLPSLFNVCPGTHEMEITLFEDPNICMRILKDPLYCPMLAVSQTNPLNISETLSKIKNFGPSGPNTNKPQQQIMPDRRYSRQETIVPVAPAKKSTSAGKAAKAKKEDDLELSSLLSEKEDSESEKKIEKKSKIDIIPTVFNNNEQKTLHDLCSSTISKWSVFYANYFRLIEDMQLQDRIIDAFTAEGFACRYAELKLPCHRADTQAETVCKFDFPFNSRISLCNCAAQIRENRCVYYRAFQFVLYWN